MLKSKDKLLILDLDETLIHAAEKPLLQQANFSVYDYHVYKRPYLDTFLTTCLDCFDVAVWTSSGAEYAAEVVSRIFPNPQALAFVWTSDRCSIVYNYNHDLIDGDCPQYYSRKPLKKVRRRGSNLESVIAIDDPPKKWEKSYGNLITVKPFEGDESDRELAHLLVYLDTLKNEKNIRSIEKRGWRDKINK
jgi:TFIIF-interacting CTD phosphatase-like protein